MNHFWRYLFSSIMPIVHIQGQGKMPHILHCYIVLQCIYDIFHRHNRWYQAWEIFLFLLQIILHPCSCPLVQTLGTQIELVVRLEIDEKCSYSIVESYIGVILNQKNMSILVDMYL